MVNQALVFEYSTGAASEKVDKALDVIRGELTKLEIDFKQTLVQGEAYKGLDALLRPPASS